VSQTGPVLLCDSETVDTVYGRGDLVAGLAYSTEDVPLVASVLRSSTAEPVFAFKTDRWRTEGIPGPVGIGGIDIEVADSGQVVVVYSTQDSGLWCARGTDVVGVKETPKPLAPSHKLQATVIRNLPRGAVAFDAMGRRVLNPRSGIFFVREAASREPSAVGVSAVRRVVVTR